MKEDIRNLPALQKNGPVRQALKILFGGKVNHHIEEILDRAFARETLKTQPIVAVAMYAIAIGPFPYGKDNSAQYVGSSEEVFVSSQFVPKYLQLVYADSGKAIPGHRFEIKFSDGNASMEKAEDIITCNTLPFYEKPMPPTLSPPGPRGQLNLFHS